MEEILPIWMLIIQLILACSVIALLKKYSLMLILSGSILESMAFQFRWSVLWNPSLHYLVRIWTVILLFLLLPMQRCMVDIIGALVFQLCPTVKMITTAQLNLQLVISEL